MAIAVVLFLFSGQSTSASMSKTMNYQGRLSDTSDVNKADGSYDFVFKIYTVAGGGSAAWTETWTSATLWTSAGGNTITAGDGGNCPVGTKKIIYGTTTNESSIAAGQLVWDTNFKESAVVQSVTTASHYLCAYNPYSAWANGDTLTNRVYVKGGIFSLSLGTITPQTVDFTGGDYYLGVTVGADSEMIPRKKLTAVPQAMNANNLSGDGYINIDNTSPAQDAANINYNPGSGTNSALSVVYGGGGGTGTALKVTQSGTGDILNLFDDTNEVFTVLNGGNVGIGTTSPNRAKLNIVDVNRTLDSALGNLYIRTSDALAADVGGSLIFGAVGNVAGDDWPTAFIGGKRQLADNFNEAAYLQFGISDSAGGMNERMRITAAGNVGIGTTNPGNTLDLNGSMTLSGNSRNIVFSDGITTVDSGGISTVGNISLNADVEANSVGEIAFKISGGSKMTITNGGNIGIGTATPGTAKLAVLGGNVGIGTTNPGHPLDVVGQMRTSDYAFFGGTDATGLRIKGTDNTNSIYQSTGNIGITANSGNKIFISQVSAPATGLTVDTTSGNVGIGTTNPLQKLHVEGHCVTGDTLLSLVNEEKPVVGENDPISRIAGTDPDFRKTRDMKDPQSREIKEKRIDQIKGGEMVMSLDEKTGKLVPAKIKGLLDMGVKPIFKITTEDGRTIRTTGNHPYLTKEGWQKVANLNEGKEIAVPKENLMALVSGDDGGESKKNHSQTYNCQNEINDEHVVHNYCDELFFNNRRLIDQKNKVQAAPVTTLQKENLSKMPGSTTEAREMRPVSAAISETFSSCESDSCMPSEYNSTQSDVKFVRIAKIELLPAEQVWDIEVEGTHNFVANGIIAHNTYISGNVGIGTTSPTRILDIIGASAQQLRISNTVADATLKNFYVQGRHYTNTEQDVAVFGYSSTAGGGYMSIGGGSSVLNTATQIDLYTAADNTTLTGTSRLTILAGGNVGIGTTNPNAAKLEVNGSIKMTDGNQGADKILRSDANGLASWITLTTLPVGNADTVDSTHVANGTANYLARYSDASHIVSSAVIYDNGTNVGIGTTNPATNLQVIGASTPVRFGNSDNTLGFQITLDATNNASKLLALSTSNIIFRENSTDTMTLKSGNVGIGTTSPNSLLTVSLNDGNDVTPQFSLENPNTANMGSIRMKAEADGAGGQIAFAGSVVANAFPPTTMTSGNASRYPGTFGYFAGVTAATSRFFFRTSPAGTAQTLTEAMSILNSGNVGIGTTNPGAKLEINGNVLGGTYNGTTITSGGGTLTLNAKTLNLSNSLTFSGADGKTINFGGNNLTLSTSADTSLTLPASGTLIANPMTTLGDIIYGGASGAPTSLAGAAGFLKSTGAAAPRWSAIALADVSVPVIGSPSVVTNLNNAYDYMWSAGVISGGDITDNGNGTVSITSGEAMLRTSASATAPLKSVTFPAANNMSLTNNTTNYIWVGYNAGSPTVATSTVSSDYNCLNKCHLYTVVREGTDLSILDGRQQNIDANRKQRKRFYETDPFDHVLGGTAIGNSGRYITVSAGAFYYSLNKVLHNAFDTSVSGTSVDRVFDAHYRDGSGGWTHVEGEKQLDNTHYDDGDGGLGTLSASYYGVHWVYLVLGETPKLTTVYGRGNYASLNDAKAEGTPQDLPPTVSGAGVLIGRLIIQKSNTTVDLVESAFSNTFSPSGVAYHSALAGLNLDDHQQYMLLSGRTGGQALIGGLEATDDLILRTTAGNAASGADMIFQTGNNGQTEAMRILYNGNVGIGTTNPGSKLHIVSTSGGERGSTVYINGVNQVNTNAVDNLLILTTDTQGSDLGGSIGLGGQVGGDSAPFAHIAGRKENANSGNYAGYLALYTQDSGASTSEWMRITSNGNVGIGTAVPRAGLDVAKYGDWTSNANIYPFPAGNVFAAFGDSVAGADNWIGVRGAYGVFTGSANLMLQAGFNNIGQVAGNYISSEAANGDLSFGAITTGGTTATAATKTERMRITNGGNVGIGTTNPLAKLEVNGTLKVDSLTTGGSALYINGGILSSSDARLKENVHDFGSVLDKIAALKPVTFDWKKDGSADTGFIAQDIQKLFPELVGDLGGGQLGVYYSKFTPYLTKAIQEQQGMINTQGAAINDQQNQITNYGLQITKQTSDVSELQTAVNEKLNVISGSLASTDAKLAAGEVAFADLKTRLAAAETKLQEDENNLATFEAGVNDTISTMLQTENMLTERVLNHEDRIKALEDKLATATVSADGGAVTIPANVITQDALGNATLAGVFKAKGIQAETGSFKGILTADSVQAKEVVADSVKADGIVAAAVDTKELKLSNGETSGRGVIKAGETSVVVATGEAGKGANVYITTYGDNFNMSPYYENVIEGQSFEVKIKTPAAGDINFNWLIIK